MGFWGFGEPRLALAPAPAGGHHLYRLCPDELLGGGTAARAVLAADAADQAHPGGPDARAGRPPATQAGGGNSIGHRLQQHSRGSCVAWLMTAAERQIWRRACLLRSFFNPCAGEPFPGPADPTGADAGDPERHGLFHPRGQPSGAGSTSGG